MSKIKDKIYNLLVRKNSDVQNEYERYVMEHIEEHKTSRTKHWKILIKLNWHYRVKKKKEVMLVWEEKVQEVNQEQIIQSPKQKVPGMQKKASEASQRKQSNVKKKYVESDMIQRTKPHWLAMEIMTYDMISFDVFDTLLFRPFADPKDLFVLVGEKLGILGFANIRVNSETEARNIHEAKYGNREVTIFDIYEIIYQKTGISIKEGVECEFSIEMEMCFANPYMKRLYNILFYQNKEMIVVSDMYFPKKYIRKLLEKNGYYFGEHIIVSCDHNCNKSGGKLYEYIKNIYPDKKIIHIGDNENGDIKKANANGIPTILYKNVNRAGKNFRAANMSRLVGSAYAGVVNTHFYNGIKKYSFEYEYGFSVGGLYIVGFTNWIHRQAKEKKVDKILFVARDGYIYKKVFEEYFDDVKTEYLYWSRIPSEICDAKNDRASFFHRFVNDKIGGKISTTIHDILYSLGLEQFEVYLGKYHLTGADPICNENHKIIKNFFNDNWDEIVRALENKGKQTIEYISSVVEGCEKVAIVDVGWTGSNVIKLKHVIDEHVKSHIDVYCWLAGCTTIVNGYLELKHEVEAYLFSYSYNRDNFVLHHKEHKPTNNLFELLTQARMPSFYGIENGEFIFDIPEVENYTKIQEMERGIMDFAKIWKKTFLNYTYMYAISGHDSYQPFAKKIQDLSCFKDEFRDFTVSMKVLANRSKQKLETIGEIL